MVKEYEKAKAIYHSSHHRKTSVVRAVYVRTHEDEQLRTDTREKETQSQVCIVSYQQ